MKDLIRKLSTVPGPAGSEHAIFKVIREEVESFVDETYTDVLGNLYAVKKANATPDQMVKTVILSAHMDEPGITVVDVDKEGFIRIAALGSLQASSLVGQRVKFTKSDAIGIIGVESGVSSDKIEMSNVFVDIAATDRSDALSKVQIGDAAAFYHEFTEISNQVIVSHALDNRIACAVAIEALKSVNLPYHLVVVFSSQQQVGSRGIQVAGYRVEPDLAMVLDATMAGDTSKSDTLNIRMGEGVAIKARDAEMVVSPALRDKLITLAEINQIPFQIEVNQMIKSEAAAIQISRGGVPTCGLSVPLRYMNTPSQMADQSDAESMLKLLLTWLNDDNLFQR